MEIVQKSYVLEPVIVKEMVFVIVLMVHVIAILILLVLLVLLLILTVLTTVITMDFVTEELVYVLALLDMKVLIVSQSLVPTIVHTLTELVIYLQEDVNVRKVEKVKIVLS